MSDSNSSSVEANQKEQESPLAKIDPTCEHYQKLLYRMKLTKGARFQTARRHKNRSIASIWAITLLSMYVFSISAFLSLYDLSTSPNVSKFLTLTNIVLSAFIIAFSVMEQGRKHDLNAELFLRCAQRIQELRDEIECHQITNPCKKDDILKYTEQYNAIVHEFSDNHSASDYMSYRIDIGKLKGDYLGIALYRVQYWLSCWSILIATAVIMPAIFASIFFLHLIPS